MKITYKTQGTCSSHIEVEVEDDVVQQVFFWGGCNGNLQGISRLVKGMKVEDVNRLLKQYDQMKQMFKQMGKNKKNKFRKKGFVPGMQLPPGFKM